MNRLKNAREANGASIVAGKHHCDKFVANVAASKYILRGCGRQSRFEQFALIRRRGVFFCRICFCIHLANTTFLTHATLILKKGDKIIAALILLASSFGLSTFLRSLVEELIAAALNKCLGLGVFAEVGGK